MKTTAEKSTTTATRPPTLLPKRGRDSFVPSSPALQAKLTVNTPGDEFEREADQTADTLMRRGSARAGEREEPSIRKQEAPPEDEIQRQCSDCEKKEETPVHTVQREASGDGDGGTTAPAIVGEVISSGGSSLDGATRTHMENHFGADFSQVRVHNDGRAHTSARAISAHAYTYGNHIAFAEGQYRPTTQSGRHLLAHELTHVVQQRPLVQRLLGTQNAAADRLLSNRPAAPAPAPTFQPPAPVPGAAPAPITPDAPAPIDQAGTDILPLEDELPTAEVPTGGEAPEEINIEPLMPPAPEEMNPEAQERLGQSQRRARLAAGNNADMPAATEMTQEAREGVNEPTQETEARASGELAGTLSQRPAPSPEIETLCENIRRIIREKRPPDEDSLLQADPEEAANEAGNQLSDNVAGDVDRVEGQYDQLDENPTGTPEQIGQPVEAPPTVVGVPEVNAAGAAPDPLTEEEVSLEADVAASAQRMEEAGMQTPAAQAVQDGPIAEARAAHGELEETAAEDPATVLAEQDAALSNARADMETLQAQALEALRVSRSRSVSGSSAQQTAMVGSEEQQRAELGRQAREIFTGAQSQVNLLLGPLSRTAMEMWERGKDRIATEFEQHLARVQRWVDDRHFGFGGGLVELWDDLTGLPDWVTDEYDDAERRFGDSICALIREISIYVNGVILTCEELIDNANREIDTLFDNAPEELREWAEGQRADFQQRLDGLREQVTTTQQNFNRDLADRAAQAVQEVRERVHALREAAKGLLGRLADALMEFLEDPLRAIINGLLRLVGIEPAAFWALVARIEQVISDIVDDPVGFASNLLSAIGAGFQRFFDNIVTHLFEGLVEWLFSGLGAVGVEIPRELSLSSIMTFFLQLMGITWERIRRLLARHIGEENVALLEQAYQIISDLIELGPAGIFELIKDQLDPRHILDTIIQMAVDFIKETLITQATVRIIGLFNPVGAIAQAIEAIYKVLKWIFQNAARIFSLVETVVNGMADIIAGNIAGMAVAVEQALKRLLVPVIDFIAEFMSMGDLPERVADAVKGLQTWVEGILDRVIGWLATRARGILEALGIREDADPEEEGQEETMEDSEVGETITFTVEEERHQLWIDTAGRGVEVMVRSNPIAVAEKLALWRGQFGTMEKNKQSQAQNLLNTAQSQLEVVQREGTEAEQKMEQVRLLAGAEEMAEAEQADQEVETAQQALKNTLAQLFEIFGETEIDLSPIRGGFTTEAEDPHEIYFEKRDGVYELLIASGQPKTYQAFLKSITIDASLPDKVAAKNELIQLLAQLETLRNGVDKEEDIENVVQQMLEKTRVLFETGKSSIPQWSALNTAGYGTKMIIEYLTSEAPPGIAGSTPTDTPHPYYDIINQRRKGGGSYYVRGHLLSQKLFGPGMWYNLSPLTGTANTQGHESMVESHLKSGTTEAPPQFRNKSAIRYEVEPQYGRGLNQGLINQMQNSTEPIPDIRTKESIVRGEAYVPMGFHIRAEELNPLSKQPIGPLAFPSVANVIDQSNPDAYQITAVSISYPIKISTATVSDLQMLFSDNIANRIVALMMADLQKPIGDREITNFQALADRVPYLREDRLKKLTEELKIVF